MDISLALKTGYFQALNPEIGIPIYDAFSVPASAVYPYVIIALIAPTEIVNAKCKSWNAAVTLDVVTGFTSPTGMNAAWNISEDIENIINPPNRNPIDLTSYGYQIGQTRSSSNPVQLKTGTYWIYRNLITFSHIIWSVNPDS